MKNLFKTIVTEAKTQGTLLNNVVEDVLQILELGLDFDPNDFHDYAAAAVHVLYTVEDEKEKRRIIRMMLLAEYYEQLQDDVDIICRKEVKAKRKIVEARSFDGATYRVAFVEFSPDDELVWAEVYPPEGVTWELRPVIPISDYKWDQLQVGPSVSDMKERDDEEFLSSIQVWNGEGSEHVFLDGSVHSE